MRGLNKNLRMQVGSIAKLCGCAISALCMLAVGMVIGYGYASVGAVPVIDHSDGAVALNAAINAYQKSLTVVPAGPSVTGVDATTLKYMSQERRRWGFLTAELRGLGAVGGSGGSNVHYMLCLSEVQESLIDKWFRARAEGNDAACADAMRQLGLNTQSMDCAILLFKLLLGRTDHQFGDSLRVYRHDGVGVWHSVETGEKAIG